MSATDSTSVRVSRDVHRRLKRVAEEEGDTMSDVIDRLLDEHRRSQFFRKVNEGFAQLRADEDEWEAYQEEIEEIEAASGDGLNEFPFNE